MAKVPGATGQHGCLFSFDPGVYDRMQLPPPQTAKNAVQTCAKRAMTDDRLNAKKIRTIVIGGAVVAVSGALASGLFAAL